MKKENNNSNKKNTYGVVVGNASDIPDTPTYDVSTSNNFDNIYLVIILFISIGAGVFFWIIAHPDPKNKNYPSVVEHAKRDISSHSYFGVKDSEITCKTDDVINGKIIVLLCETTNSQIEKYYGSKKIYYAEQEAANGYGYYYFSSNDKQKVIDKVK